MTDVAEHKLCVGEQGAEPDNFTHAAKHHQHQGETQPHHKAIQRGIAHVVFRRESFGAGNDGTVSNDQWDEDAEHQVQFVEPGVHAEFNGGDDGGDDEHKNGNADLGF